MTTCRIPGCTSPIATKKSGLCMRHYKQDRRGHLPTTPPPAVGSPSGHGTYGILDGDGDAVMCHECGKWLQSLSVHTSRLHDLTAREYKLKHGLPLGTPLRSERLVKESSEKAKAQVGSEKWKRLEAKRDPIAASNARDKESFQSMSRAHGQDPNRSLEALAKVGPKSRRVQTCEICGKQYQKKPLTRTCGDKLCISIVYYEAQPTYREMRERARLHEVEGLNFSEIARDRGVTPQAVRVGYRGWQRYQEWKRQAGK